MNFKLEPQYLSAIVIVVISVAKMLGVEIGSETLTEWITSAIIVANGIIIAVKTLREKKLTWFGAMQK